MYEFLHIVNFECTICLDESVRELTNYICIERNERTKCMTTASKIFDQKQYVQCFHSTKRKWEKITSFWPTENISFSNRTPGSSCIPMKYVCRDKQENSPGKSRRKHIHKTEISSRAISKLIWVNQNWVSTHKHPNTQHTQTYCHNFTHDGVPIRGRQMDV